MFNNVCLWIFARKGKHQAIWEELTDKIKLAIFLLTYNGLLNLLMQIARQKKKIGTVFKPVCGFLF